MEWWRRQGEVDGEVRNVWTQKVFQMIENNNKIISSPELSGLTGNSVWKSLGAGNRKDLDKKRHRLAKELLVNNMQSDLPDINNPLESCRDNKISGSGFY
jgi:hypothetical protein